MREFLEVFIPLFVAVDPFGLLPIFLAVTATLTPKERHRVAAEAAATAFIIAMVFMFLGGAIFHFLGIESADFKIGGGVLLLVLAVLDIVIVGKPAVHDREMVGIVPLGMPLIAGPAMLTTILVFSSREGYGYGITAAATVANFAILLLVLRSAHVVVGLVGMNTLKAMSKLVMVLLCAIAVQFIRSGVMEILHR
jgi:multiple antibiotic resistance protein